jgi:hypothetical protein
MINLSSFFQKKSVLTKSETKRPLSGKNPFFQSPGGESPNAVKAEDRPSFVSGSKPLKSTKTPPPESTPGVTPPDLHSPSAKQAESAPKSRQDEKDKLSDDITSLLTSTFGPRLTELGVRVEWKLVNAKKPTNDLKVKPQEAAKKTESDTPKVKKSVPTKLFTNHSFRNLNSPFPS